MNKSCATCAASFEPKDPRKLYCSKSCQKRASYLRNREVRLADVAAYRSKNREKILEKGRREWAATRNDSAKYERYKASRRKNGAWFRMRRAHGVSKEQYEAMLTAQGGVCAICRGLQTPQGPIVRLVVDHDHSTGAVRGLLCANCNVGIGMLKDDPEIIRRAVEYVNRAA